MTDKQWNQTMIKHRITKQQKANLEYALEWWSYISMGENTDNGSRENDHQCVTNRLKWCLDNIEVI